MHMHYSEHVGWTEQLAGIRVLLPPGGKRGSNSHAQAPQQMPLPADSLAGPMGSFFNTKMITCLPFSDC